MKYTIPLRITVRIGDDEVVKRAAEAQLLAEFGMDENDLAKNP